MKKGFSLIELLIVLFICGVLSALIYPIYQEHIIAARRNDGRRALLFFATRMEAYYLKHQTYETATIATNKSTDALPSSLSSEGWYTVSILKATPLTYTLAATPRLAQARMDKRCRTLTLTHTGLQGAADPTAHCW